EDAGRVDRPAVQRNGRRRGVGQVVDADGEQGVRVVRVRVVVRPAGHHQLAGRVAEGEVRPAGVGQRPAGHVEGAVAADGGLLLADEVPAAGVDRPGVDVHHAGPAAGADADVV